MATLSPQLIKFVKKSRIHKYYRHTKTGGLYKVKHLSLHTEEVTQLQEPQLLVNYIDLDGIPWTRPYDMFFSNIEIDINKAVFEANSQGKTLNDMLHPQPRFRKITRRNYYSSKLRLMFQ